MYEAHRPTYPVELVTEVLKFLDEQNPGEKRRGFMLDVGCGGGQATRLLAPHFEKVLGIDISASQINMAKRAVPNAEFQIGSASNLLVESGSVDLVIVGSAVHFFDLDAFLRECDRALRPGGCVALFTYWPSRIKAVHGGIIAGLTNGSGISCLTERFLKEIGVGVCMLNILAQHYKSIYNQINKSCKRRVTGIELEKQFTVDEFILYFSTFGEYHASKDCFGNVDPLVIAKRRLQTLLGFQDDNSAREPFTVTFEYPTVLFRK